jgi:hypothetical protein
VCVTCIEKRKTVFKCEFEQTVSDTLVKGKFCRSFTDIILPVELTFSFFFATIAEIVTINNYVRQLLPEFIEIVNIVNMGERAK